jgi:hypothetical protein
MPRTLWAHSVFHHHHRTLTQFVRILHHPQLLLIMLLYLLPQTDHTHPISRLFHDSVTN